MLSIVARCKRLGILLFSQVVVVYYAKFERFMRRIIEDHIRIFRHGNLLKRKNKIPAPTFFPPFPREGKKKNLLSTTLKLKIHRHRPPPFVALSTRKYVKEKEKRARELDATLLFLRASSLPTLDIKFVVLELCGKTIQKKKKK